MYIAAKSPESLPIDDEYDYGMYREILKNTLFSYSPNPTHLIDIFWDMQKNCQPRPEVIVIDFLHTFFDYFSELDIDISLHTNFIECHMLMTASLFSAVDMFCNGDSSNTTAAAKNFMSIVCIDPQCNDIYKRFIQTYVDSYYYKNGSILSFDDLMEKFPYQS